MTDTEKQLLDYGITCECESLGSIKKVSARCPLHNKYAAQGLANKIKRDIEFKTAVFTALQQVCKLTIDDPMRRSGNSQEQLDRNAQVYEGWHVHFIKPLERLHAILETLSDTQPDKA